MTTSVRERFDQKVLDALGTEPIHLGRLCHLAYDLRLIPTRRAELLGALMRLIAAGEAAVLFEDGVLWFVAVADVDRCKVLELLK